MNYFRKKYTEKEWNKKVDISVLFMMREATARIRKEAEQIENKRILEEVGQLERAIATAGGRGMRVNPRKFVRVRDARANRRVGPRTRRAAGARRRSPAHRTSRRRPSERAHRGARRRPSLRARRAARRHQGKR